MPITFDHAWTPTPVKTSAYTAAIGEQVLCNPTGGAFTVTLPSAVNLDGRSILVSNRSSSTTAITIDGFGAETINGAATQTIVTAWQTVILIPDGTNWTMGRWNG